MTRLRRCMPLAAIARQIDGVNWNIADVTVVSGYGGLPHIRKTFDVDNWDIAVVRPVVRARI